MQNHKCDEELFKTFYRSCDLNGTLYNSHNHYVFLSSCKKLYKYLMVSCKRREHTQFMFLPDTRLRHFVETHQFRIYTGDKTVHVTKN